MDFKETDVKQEVCIGQMEKDITWLMKTVDRIENNHLVHINEKIEAHDKYLIASLTTAMFSLIGIITTLAVILLQS
jgi:hypothetical protein